MFLSCVYVEQMQSNFCWAIQLLLSLMCCIRGDHNPREMPGLPAAGGGGQVLPDSLCSLFALLQHCIFLSHHSLHIKAELHIFLLPTTLQASRSFALFKAADLKSIDLHHKAEKSPAQLCQA